MGTVVVLILLIILCILIIFVFGVGQLIAGIILTKKCSKKLKENPKKGYRAGKTIGIVMIPLGAVLTIPLTVIGIVTICLCSYPSSEYTSAEAVKVGSNSIYVYSTKTTYKPLDYSVNAVVGKDIAKYSVKSGLPVNWYNLNTIDNGYGCDMIYCKGKCYVPESLLEDVEEYYQNDFGYVLCLNNEEKSVSEDYQTLLKNIESYKTEETSIRFSAKYFRSFRLVSTDNVFISKENSLCLDYTEEGKFICVKQDEEGNGVAFYLKEDIYADLYTLTGITEE